ncbi:MAG: (d)CMP kinase, partial [Saprospiraceae bacterium]|nr:(d)CMP kinase [Saprospiraceae bacterium]
LKIFLTASQDVRTQRRLAEMKAKNIQITYEDVRDDLLKRDKIDSERSDSPLKQAQDAILIDNSALSIDDVADLIEEKVEKFTK